MANAIVPVPEPINEPVRAYAPGSPEKASLKARIDEMLAQEIEIPLVIGGQEVRTGKMGEAVCPARPPARARPLSQGGREGGRAGDRGRAKAWAEWSEMPWEHRAAILLKAAELLAGPWRDTLNAATMLGQSKTVFQAEIDAACELIDFFRFNPYYMRFIYEQQPEATLGLWNYVEYRPLEGFVFAVTPFNFTSIAGNLPTAPALMGNTVLWKPASSAVYSAHWLMKLLEEAGFPPGVINFVPGSGGEVGDPVLASPDFAGVHFTGSTAVFHGMWKTIGENIARYRSYPRIVGETGGKDFVFAHPSADVEALATALVRGAFEYQGQKCSAASRAYIPRSIWPRLKKLLVGQIAEIKIGRADRLPQLHERGHRQRRLRRHQGLHRLRQAVERREDPRRRRLRRFRRLLHRADRGRDHGPALQADGGGDLRPGADALRLRRRRPRRRPRAVRHHEPLRADRRHLRAGPRGGG